MNFSRVAVLVRESHLPNSFSRNLHCLPILIAGISSHSAHRQTVLADTPSHFATAAVVISGSRFKDNFSISQSLFGFMEWEACIFPLATSRTIGCFPPVRENTGLTGCSQPRLAFSF